MAKIANSKCVNRIDYIISDRFHSVAFFFNTNTDARIYIAFLLGLAIGVYIGATRLVSPFRFAPLIRRGDLAIEEEEVHEILVNFWEKFPRNLLWLSILPYLLVFTFTSFLSTNQGYEAIYLLRVLLFSFASTVLLCPGVFFLYAYFSWKISK